MSPKPMAALLAAAFATVPAVYADPVYVPDALAEWQEWVLEGQEYRQCPAYYDRTPSASSDYVCAWPQVLELDVDAAGGTFTQRWRVSAGDAWLPLPGDTDNWPDQVTLNGEAVPVVLHDGAPSVHVGAGNHRLAGRFGWDERPGVLPIPPQSGLVALTVNGVSVPRPVLNRNGVFLGDGQRESRTPNALDTAVYRLLADDVPLRLTTRFRLDVAGTVREEVFAPVLPEGYIPLAVSSALPVRLEADGSLHVQVRPGRWEITLVSRARGVETSVSLPEARRNLPPEEIWSYQPSDRLRVTAASGLPPVDPGEAQVPDEWAGLPAFRVEPGATLEIEERSRGQTTVDNDLALRRGLWLDFNGDGFTVRDQVEGEMRRDWRLDMRPPYMLRSATEEGENLLVTAGEGEQETGVELRQTNVDVEATARIEERGPLPVTGWDARFSAVATTLYLPPGNKLLVAMGADRADGSWFAHWELLDFFLVLIITIAAWRLFGPLGGVIALFALVLSFHERGAPSWLWLNLLIGVALLRVAPAGRLQHLARAWLGIGAALLVLTLVPFVARELRIAIYPQLEPQYSTAFAGQRDIASPAAPVPDDLESTRSKEISLLQLEGDDASVLEEVVVTGVSNAKAFPRYAPNAVVQTGPGIPNWEWNAAELHWNGPVEAEETVRFVILPRWAVSLLRCLEVLLLLLFTAVVAANALERRWRLPGGFTFGRGAAALALLLWIGLPADDARAEVPTPELLQELERRLTQPPECAPRCAEIVAASVRIDGDRISMLLAIDALREVAVPLPGTLAGWRPDAVQLGQAQVAEVLRGPEQGLWVRVPAGRNSVTLRGPAGDTDSVEIVFPAPPRVVEVTANGWSVAGIRDRRLLSGALQFTREQADLGEGAPERWESSRFPPFAEVIRTIEMGLDWTVSTTVERIAPADGALALRVPLLPGESVLADHLPVSDGEILVTMAPGETSVSWQSRLPRTSPLVLAAPASASWQEVWRLTVGSIWHVEFDGVPESVGSGAAGGVRTAEFHPRAGERLNVAATRPEAVAGSTMAFDAVEVRIEQGERSRTGDLALAYRSTRGAQHVVRLPPESELVKLSIDGRIEALRIEEDAVSLPLAPGEHSIELRWRDPTPIGITTAVPAIDLGAPASNLSLELQLPGDRWLLFTSGPRLGPSVLYWSELAVLVLLAGLLSRIPWTPLGFRHWLLLGLGFSTFNWPVLGLVVLWLVAVGARDRWRISTAWWQYNALQGVLVVVTLLALFAIVLNLQAGLLGTPDMSVAGNGSRGNLLKWFADRAEARTPGAMAWSLPLWVYKLLILAWALWLSLALIRWVPWTWQVLARDGFLRPREVPAP
jgi:hypothetical protein